MDHKTFVSRLAERMGCPAEQAATLIDSLTGVLRTIGSELDSAALPGFGTFSTVKTDEQIVTDETTGARTLVPPAIRMSFAPSVVLRKKITR